MQREDTKYICQRINYDFCNLELLDQAFTRSSYARENNVENNEILELIGDSVLYMYVTKYLTYRYGQLKTYDDSTFGEFYMSNGFTEKEITNIRQRLISGEYLAERIDKMELNSFMFLDKGDLNNHKQNSIKVKADLFEAILGAIAIDCHWNDVYLKNSVEYMLDIDRYISNEMITDDNYIVLLQQWNQKEFGVPPHYEIVQDYDGSVIAYVVIATSNGEIQFSGRGKNRTTAKMETARKAYEYLEDHDELFTIMDEITEKITPENSINKLQELAQKGYFSFPEYYQGDTQRYDEYGYPLWECICIIRSEGIQKSAFSSSKKLAKKKAAYSVMRDIFGWAVEE